MEFKCSEKLNHFSTGIFAALDEKKNELIRQGRTIYNLSVGTPDFSPAEHIMKTRKTLNRILSENSGVVIDKIEKDTDRDNYMTAEEAKEYGIIDEIFVSRGLKLNEKEKTND